MRKVIFNSKYVKDRLTTSGQESEVFNYVDKDGRELVFKRFKAYNTRAKEEKLEVLSGIEEPSFLVPVEDMIYKDGKFIGYTRKKYKGTHVDYTLRRDDIVKYLEEVKNIMLRLNEQGIYIGDIASDNFIRTKDGKVISIDIDNYRVNTPDKELDFDIKTMYMIHFEDKHCDPKLLDHYCYNVYVLSLLGHYCLGAMNPKNITLPRCLRGRGKLEHNEEALEETKVLHENYSGKLILLPSTKKKNK